MKVIGIGLIMLLFPLNAFDIKHFNAYIISLYMIIAISSGVFGVIKRGWNIEDILAIISGIFSLSLFVIFD